MSAKRILIIGGAGYIGSHIALELTQAGYKAVILDDFSSGSLDNILTDFELITGDYSDQKILARALTSDISAVILVAALKSVEQSMTDIISYSQVNIAGAINLLNAMIDKGITEFYFASSAAVYGDSAKNPVAEDSPTDPISFYGYSKLVIEQLLPWYAQIKGLKYGAFRYFNVAGYDANLRCPALEQNPRNLLPIIMEVLFKQRAELKLFGSDYDTVDGSAVRDYVHVSDIARGHRLGLYYIKNGGKSFICNLASGRPASVLELANLAQQISGAPLEIVKTDRRVGDIAKFYADNSLAQKLLGWQPQHSSLNEIVGSSINAYKNKLG